jgi:hypothetical protein
MTNDDPVFIIICHDESTFKSSESQSSSWNFPKHANFYNKGQGKSIMLSYFLVQHKYSDLFELDEKEWKEAVTENPSLLENDSFLNYEPRSANAWIEPGKDCYFNNDTIIKQFERLFILLKYKTIFKNHNIVIIVDNARTHTAKKYDINLISKSECTKCPYDKLEWIDKEGISRSIDCLSDDGETKGLFNICKELNIIKYNLVPKGIKLDDLRALACKHDVFSQKSNLELLADKYKIIIKFCPKFHCELNPIEGLWCQMKQWVRKRTNQTFNKMKTLMEESKQVFTKNLVNAKLWRRFWQGLNMYNDPKLNYLDIIVLLYGARTRENLNHRFIYNTKLEK